MDRKMDTRTIIALGNLGACEETIAWCRTQPSRRVAWEQCPRPDWMLWLIGRTIKTRGSARHRRLVEVTCQLVKPWVWRKWGPATAPRKAILLAMRWARGDDSITQSDLRAAAKAAYAAHADAAYFAAYVVYAANADDAVCGANAANAVYAVYAANADDAAAKKRMAARLRRFYPNAPRLKAR